MVGLRVDDCKFLSVALILLGWLLSCFYLMIRQPPRSTQSRSSAASDVYKRQEMMNKKTNESLENVLIRSAIRIAELEIDRDTAWAQAHRLALELECLIMDTKDLSLIHISEPTRLLSMSYAVLCLKKKKTQTKNPAITFRTSRLNSYMTIYITLFFKNSFIHISFLYTLIT